MTFENIQSGRVLAAVAIIFAIGILISFTVQFGFIMARVLDAMGDLDPNATRAEQQELLQGEIDSLLDETQEGSSSMRTLSLVQWALTAVAAFFVARRTSRTNAISPEQGVGYGVLIGAGAMLLYGLCICTSPTEMVIKLIFFVILFVATVLGGQLGGQNPKPKGQPAPARVRLGAPPRRSPAGGGADAYYNMGVQAALGGRREEAREHFTHVLQMQPRHVPAWLQLANLAESPEQAWNYIQQARSIDANDPAVLRAVDVIWPQVAASARGTAPHLQPPYPGATADDAEIPSSTLPRGSSGDVPTREELDTLFDEADTPILPVPREPDEDDGPPVPPAADPSDRQPPPPPAAPET